MTDNRTLRRGASAVIAATFPDEAGRGRRVLILSDDSPDPENLAGHVLVSFDEVPHLLSPVLAADLLPLEDRPCVTGDPRCCLLEPCAGCVLLLRAHLSAALLAGGIQGPSGEAFVRAWNEARTTARAGVRETTRQARDYAARAAETMKPLAEAVEGRTVTAEEARAAVLLQEDAPKAPETSETGEEDAHKSNVSEDKTELSTTTGEPVEKKGVTARRARRSKETSPDAPSSEAAPPAKDDETPGGPLGAEAPAGPRGG